MGQMGQEKCTEEIESTHKMSDGNPERKTQFARSRPR